MPYSDKPPWRHLSLSVGHITAFKWSEAVFIPRLPESCFWLARGRPRLAKTPGSNELMRSAQAVMEHCTVDAYVVEISRDAFGNGWTLEDDLRSGRDAWPHRAAAFVEGREEAHCFVSEAERTSERSRLPYLPPSSYRGLRPVELP